LAAHASEKLRANLRLNPWSTNVRVERLALSNFPGLNNTAFQNSWPLFGKPEPQAPELVRSTTLDEYAADLQRRIDFLKIDVDGYEFKVLSGAADTLRRHRPVIVIELCAHALEAVGDSMKDLVELIFSQGYTVTDADSLVNLNTVEDVLKAVPQTQASMPSVCPLVRWR